MRRLLLLAVVVIVSGQAQFPPDGGTVVGPLDPILGQVIPPALNATYAALGQNITREDIQLFLDLNITKGDIGVMGLLIGSGPIEVEAKLKLRGEMRVISSERIQQALYGNDPYNVSADNATFLSEAYLPAEVFRATLTAEAIALFQEEQEKALRTFIEDTVPELNIISLAIAWENVLPTDALTDFSLTEPPIVVTLDATLQFLRVESIPSLLGAYWDARPDEDDPKKAHIKSLKADHGDLLRTRDFFAAAAYTQLLNLSLQPGWSLDVELRVPRGFTFEYFNEQINVTADRQSANFRVDGSASDGDVDLVVLASLTQRRAVALALFIAMGAVSALLIGLPRRIYSSRRVPRLLAPKPDP